MMLMNVYYNVVQSNMINTILVFDPDEFQIRIINSFSIRLTFGNPFQRNSRAPINCGYRLPLCILVER